MALILAGILIALIIVEPVGCNMGRFSFEFPSTMKLEFYWASTIPFQVASIMSFVPSTRLFVPSTTSFMPSTTSVEPSATYILLSVTYTVIALTTIHTVFALLMTLFRILKASVDPYENLRKLYLSIITLPLLKHQAKSSEQPEL